MEYLFIYCLQLNKVINVLLGCSLFVCLCLTIGTIICYAEAYEYITNKDSRYGEAERKAFKILKTGAIATAVVSIVLSLLPTKQTLLLMGGTYLGKKAAKEIITSQKLEKVNTIIDLQLDKYIKELKTGL